MGGVHDKEATTSMCCYAIARVFLRLSANNELLYIWMNGEPSLARDRPRRDLGAALRERDPGAGRTRISGCFASPVKVFRPGGVRATYAERDKRCKQTLPAVKPGSAT